MSKQIVIMLKPRLKQDTLNNTNIFSPEEEVATGGSAPMHVRILASKDTRMAEEEACFFLESSPINKLDFVLFGMIVAQNNRINRLIRISVYTYNY